MRICPRTNRECQLTSCTGECMPIPHIHTPLKWEGEFSTSMNVNTRPAHRFEVNGFWVLVDPKMPEKDFEKFKAKCIEKT